jgi:uncharacterized protein YlxW (UPF0749 family)
MASARHRDELSNAENKLLAENTELTEQVAKLTREIDDLTHKIHQRVEASHSG